MSFRPQELVDQLFHRFGTPTTLVDTSNHLVAFSIQPPERTDAARRMTTLSKEVDLASQHIHDLADSAQQFTRIPASRQFDTLERVVVPLRFRGHITGRLYLIDPDRRVTEELLTGFHPAMTEVARQIELERMSRHDVRALLAGLVGPGKKRRRIAAESLIEYGLIDPADTLQIAVIGGTGQLDAVSDSVYTRAFGRHSVAALVGGRVVVILAGTKPSARDRVHAAVTAGATTPAGVMATCGIGSTVTTLNQAHRSYQEAIKAWALAHLGLITNPVAEWETIGAWRTLLLLNQQEAKSSIDPRVRLMINEEEPVVLEGTRRFLEHGTDIAALATELHLHRTTLYARNRRLQDRYGLSWDDPEDRLATIIGLRIDQLHRPENSPRTMITPLRVIQR